MPRSSVQNSYLPERNEHIHKTQMNMFIIKNGNNPTFTISVEPTLSANAT